MRSSLLRFGLFSLLAMPTMFVLGWWARDRNYDRDVYLSAAQIAHEAGGEYIPELGVIRGGRDLAKGMQAMSPQARAEMARRLTYFHEVMEPDFDPPKPSFGASLKSLFFVGDGEKASDDSEVQFGPSPTEASDTAQNQGTIENRIEAFRRMRQNGSVDESRDLAPIE